MGLKIKILIYITLFVLSSIILKAQLPYSANNLCLDKIVSIDDTSKFAKNMAVADFDNDGDKDVAIINTNTQQVFIYKSNGFGQGFTLISFIATIGVLQNNSISHGDYNNDGLEDIAVCYFNQIKIFKNSGAFNFSSSYSIPIPSSNYSQIPAYIASADFNQDGKDEIIYFGSTYTPSTGISVLVFQNFSTSSTLSFGNLYSTQVFNGAQSLGILDKMDYDFGDYNNDGSIDIIITYQNNLDIACVLKCSPTGTVIGFSSLTLPISPLANLKPTLCAFGNLNGDVNADLITYSENSTSNKVSIFASTASTFIIVNSFTINPSIGSLNDFKLKDLNNDSYDDFIGITNLGLLFIYNNTATTVINPTTTIFIPYTASLTALNAEELIVEDFDNNSIPDFFIKNWLNSGSKKAFVIPNFSYDATINDFNSVLCNSNSSASLSTSGNISVTPTPGLNESFLWYANTNTLVALSTTTTYTTNLPNTYFYNLKFLFPYDNNQACTIKSNTVEVLTSTNNFTVLITPNTSTLVCLGTKISYTASGANTYTWNPGNITNSNLSQYILANIIYTVLATDSDGCQSANTLQINLYPKNTNTISVSPTTICKGDVVTLSFPPASAQTYTWSTGSNNSSITLSPSSNTTILLSYKDNNCVYVDSAKVIIDSNCDSTKTTSITHNAITPNGDGINDAFFIENIENNKLVNLTVYNRWGQQISYVKNYDNTTNFWPSREQANSLVSTTYYYIINFGDGTIKKGWIEILNN